MFKIQDDFNYLKNYLIASKLIDKDSYDYYLKTHPELKKQKLEDELRDVVCIGAATNPWISTNIDTYLGCFEQMNWGYLGTGPMTLSKNILYLFTGGNKDFAKNNFIEFTRDFLMEKKQTEDLRIKKELIFKWIKEKQSKGDNIVQQ